MFQTTQTASPFQTIFGGGYVPEQHSDETRFNLPPVESREIDLDFRAMLKSLRSALGLQQAQAQR